MMVNVANMGRDIPPEIRPDEDESGASANFMQQSARKRDDTHVVRGAKGGDRTTRATIQHGLDTYIDVSLSKGYIYVCMYACTHMRMRMHAIEPTPG